MVGERERGGEQMGASSRCTDSRFDLAGCEGDRARHESLVGAEMVIGEGGVEEGDSSCGVGRVGEGGVESARGVVGGEGITTEREGGDRDWRFDILVLTVVE